MTLPPTCDACGRVLCRTGSCNGKIFVTITIGQQKREEGEREKVSIMKEINWGSGGGSVNDGVGERKETQLDKA